MRSNALFLFESLLSGFLGEDAFESNPKSAVR